MAQSVKHPILDLGSGHDLKVHESETRIRICVYDMEPAWDSAFLSLCPSPTCAL